MSADGKIALPTRKQLRISSEEDIERMNNAVGELHGHLVGEHGVGLLKKKYAPLGITTKIKELKAQYDPSNIMNRGKVI